MYAMYHLREVLKVLCIQFSSFVSFSNTFKYKDCIYQLYIMIGQGTSNRYKKIVSYDGPILEAQ